MLTFVGVIRAYAHCVCVLYGSDNGMVQWESLRCDVLGCVGVKHVFCFTPCLFVFQRSTTFCLFISLCNNNNNNCDKSIVSISFKIQSQRRNKQNHLG